jgi:hypothetical protein
MSDHDPPWQNKTLAELGHDKPHDDASCQTCAPIMARPAYHRGIARAGEDQTQLPMSSSEDSRPGRDGYETPR